MFDLKITEIFSTIGVGIVATILCIYLYFVFNKLFVKDKYDRDRFKTWIFDRLKDDYKTSSALVFIIIIYFIGVIASNLTDHMTDSDESHKNFVIKELKWVSGMPTEGDLRQISLFDSNLVTGLGKSIFRTKLVTESANRINATVFFKDSAIMKSDDSLNISLKRNMRDKNFAAFVNTIYYSSKNWCYSKEGENLNELKSLQNQVDFARSVVLMIVFAFQAIFLMLIANAVLFLIKKSTSWKDFFIPWKEIMLMVFVFFCCRECYMICEINFNKRAYGNYISFLQEIPIEKSSGSVMHYININCMKDSSLPSGRIK